MGILLPGHKIYVSVIIFHFGGDGERRLHNSVVLWSRYLGSVGELELELVTEQLSRSICQPA